MADETPLALVTGPMLGAIVVDRDSDDSRPELCVVVHEGNRKAEDCYIDAIDATVADVNPDYHPDGEVVDVQFMSSFMAWSDATYSYPVERLNVVDPISDYLNRYPEALQPKAFAQLKPFVERVRSVYGTYDDLENFVAENDGQ